MTKEFLRESIRHNIMIHDQLDVSKVIRDQNTGTVFLCAGIEHDDQRIRFTIDPDSKVVAFFTLVFSRGSGQYRSLDSVVFKNNKSRITATPEEIRTAPRDVREAVHKFIERAEKLGYIVH